MKLTAYWIAVFVIGNGKVATGRCDSLARLWPVILPIPVILGGFAVHTKCKYLYLLSKEVLRWHGLPPSIFATKEIRIGECV